MSPKNLAQKPALALTLLASSLPAAATGFIDVEATAFKPAYNDVQIPNSDQGDRFDINDITEGFSVAPRITLGWNLAENHEAQLVIAPFSYSDSGRFDEDIRFKGVTFTRSEDTEVGYQFSSYRLRYLYHLVDTNRWHAHIGGTLFVRDASIKLSQNGVSREDEDLGVVPLLALRSDYYLNARWSVLLDADAAYSSQGRALDLALLLKYELGSRWSIAGGYRTIEGGADNDEIYNFAWFNGASLKMIYQI